MKHRSNVAGIFALVVILPIAMSTGVSHAGKEDAAGSVDLEIPRLDEFSSAYVIVKGTPEVESHKKFKASAATLSDMMVEKLNEAGVFESVSAGVPEQASADLGITLLVDTFKYTGAGRYVGGIMAGKAKLAMLVTLTSGETGETVAEFRLAAVSKRSHGVFGTTTLIQSGRMTEQVAQAIAREKRPE
jgi:hypothetical protein